MTFQKKSRRERYIVRDDVERVKGVEPSYRPWEGRVLPMNYTRMNLFHYTIELEKIQPNFAVFFRGRDPGEKTRQKGSEK